MDRRNQRETQYQPQYRDDRDERRGDYRRERYDSEMQRGSGRYEEYDDAPQMGRRRPQDSDPWMGPGWDRAEMGMAQPYYHPRSRYGHPEDMGSDADRGYFRQRQSDYGRRDDRGFFDKAADEVQSWFGDDAAERRREEDHRGRGPANYKRSDARIEEDVNDRLTDDSYVDASDITVTVSDREVTLDGQVTSRRAKRRAEDCCDSVSGVTHVQNNLRVRDSRSGMTDTGQSGVS